VIDLTEATVEYAADAHPSTAFLNRVEGQVGSPPLRCTAILP
jgi:hypothetical protein